MSRLHAHTRPATADALRRPVVAVVEDDRAGSGRASDPARAAGRVVSVKTIDKGVLTAGLLTVAQVCRDYPGARGNPSLNPATVTRWILKGCPSRGGRRLKLKATRCGSRWLIDPAGLAAFFEALAGTAPQPEAPTPTAPPPRTDAQRRAASERAAKELKRRGA